MNKLALYFDLIKLNVNTKSHSISTFYIFFSAITEDYGKWGNFFT